MLISINRQSVSNHYFELQDIKAVAIIMRWLKVVEFIREFRFRLFVQTLSGEVGQLVSVLARSGDSYGTRPIVVQVAEFVSHTLHVVWLQAGGVVYHVVRSRSHRTLAYGLRHYKEVVPLVTSDLVVDYGARRRIGQLLALLREESVVDTLFYDDESHLRTERGGEGIK